MFSSEEIEFIKYKRFVPEKHELFKYFVNYVSNIYHFISYIIMKYFIVISTKKCMHVI